MACWVLLLQTPELASAVEKLCDEWKEGKKKTLICSCEIKYLIKSQDTTACHRETTNDYYWGVPGRLPKEMKVKLDPEEEGPEVIIVKKSGWYV